MPYYKSPDNKLHFLDSETFEHLLPQSAMRISDDEAASIQARETPPTPPKTQFTSLEYLDRFTDAEQLAVVSATLQSPQVKLWYDRLLAASYIDLTDPRTEGGIDALISAGLIDASRKEALMQPG